MFQCLRKLPTELHHTRPEELEKKDSLIYNYYNLDPDWHAGEDWQRILLLEPSLFKQFPISEKCLDFALSLSLNIKGIKIVVAEMDEVTSELDSVEIRYKEHPLNSHYPGKEEARDWIFPVEGYFPSFFAYWKRCKKEMLV